MNDAEKNLTKYLEMENLLNTLFNELGYCLEKCIKPEILKNGGLPVAACCKNRYHCLYDLAYPAYDLLRDEREKRYGTPTDQIIKEPVSPCEYHGLSGCRILTHKSPICLAFMCRESIDYMRETYSIFEYDYLGVNYALEWILTGDFTDKQYIEFKESVRKMIDRVIEVNRKKDCKAEGV